MMDAAAGSALKLCSTCHQALDAHFDEILATLSASKPTSWTSSRQSLMVQQVILMVKHHILDGDIGDNDRFDAAFRLLLQKDKKAR